MNFGPAQTQQKIMLVTGIVIVLIIAVGSWYVAQQIKMGILPVPESNTQSASPDLATTSDFVPGGELVVRMREATDSPTTAGTTTYLLSVAPTQVPLTGLALKLQITGASALTTQLTSFSTSSTLAGTGWQSMSNATSTTEDGIGVELSLLNLSPEGWMSGQPLELGMISFKALASDTSPQFTLDQEASSAFTKDGKELTVSLVLEPKATE